MKILILGGFLGSGKTTALMQLVHYIVDHSSIEKANKVMILENEIGEIGIDDKFIRSSGLHVENLFAGCACCTISGEMISATERILHVFDPEWLVVETTGIAYPLYIKQNLLSALNLDSRISILVDAARWDRLLIPMNDLLRGQIVESDTVLINKTDLVDASVIKKVTQDITDFDQQTTIHQINAVNQISDEIWKSVLGI